MSRRFDALTGGVVIGYVLPLALLMPQSIALPFEERIRATREGLPGDAIRTPWDGFRHRRARLARISPFRGKLYVARSAAMVCICLAMASAATVALIGNIAESAAGRVAVPSPPLGVPAIEPPAEFQVGPGA